MKKILFSGLGISILIHVILFLFLGSIVLIQEINRQEETFEASPVQKRIKPPKKKYKISVDKAKKSSSTPKSQKIAIPKVSLPNLPNIDLKGSANPKFLGGNQGVDFGDDGGDFGNAVKVTLFGIESASERIFLIIDASKRTLADSLGGIPGYQRMKDQVYKFINESPGGILFNVVIFSKYHFEVFSKEMLRSTDGNRKKLQKWLQPINQKSYTNITKNNSYIDPNIHPLFKNVPSLGKAIQVAMKQGCDCLYMMSAGWEDNRMGDLFNRSDKERYNKFLRQQGFSDKDIEKASVSFNKSNEIMKKVQRQMQNIMRQEDQSRASKGLPPKVRSKQEIAKIRQIARKKVGYDKLTKGSVSLPQPPKIQRSHFEKYLQELFQRYYTSKNKKTPVFNNLLFCAKKPESEHYKNLQRTNITWLRRISSLYKGEFKTLYLQELQIR